MMPFRPLELSISQNSVGLDGAINLTSALSKVHGLTKLDLSANQIENDVMSSLLQALQPFPLVSLNMSNNTLGSEGASALAAHIKANPHFPLQSLDLSFNGIGDDGAHAIIEALNKQPYSCLAELDLSYNGITAAGVEGITDLVKETPGIICLNVMDDGLDATVTETLNHKLQSHKALQPPKVQLNSCTHDTAKEQRVGTPCKRRLHAQRLLFIPVQRYGSASRRVLRNPYAGAVRQWHGLQPHLGV
jgi:Ran GTPase-activating protein (RanGAP) involved in mRNA processing and transport